MIVSKWKGIIMVEIIKLVSGEEIIATTKNLDNGIVELDKPCVIQIVPSRANPDQPAMALLPYAVYTEKHRIKISAKDIVWREEPLKELYNQYSSAFGSGIQFASV